MAGTQALFLFPLTQLRVTLKAITSPKDLSSVFEEIAQQAQKQFELGGGEQTPKRPPISITSDSELVSVLDDARDNIMCDMHKNTEITTT
eukprot:g38500.t1